MQPDKRTNLKPTKRSGELLVAIHVSAFNRSWSLDAEAKDRDMAQVKPVVKVKTKAKVKSEKVHRNKS